VRIFDYDGIDWNSTILPISVQAGGLLGNRIDLTPDGNTIAICGKENPNRYAQVYSFDGTNWTQKGSDIAPIQPAVGIFAFGGIIYNMDAQNLYIVNIHHQVFTSRYLSNCSAIVNALTTEGYTDWQIPSETDLDNICPSKSFIDLAASNYPNTVSFGTNSTYVSSQTFCNGGNNGAGPYCIPYYFDNTGGSNCMLGGYYGNCCCQAADFWLRSVRVQPFNSSSSNRQSVTISDDGNTLVMGDPNYGNTGIVNTYKWDGSSWVKTGNSIYGSNTNDMFGWSTSISGDGNILAVGAYQDDNNGTDAGLVKIYEWDGSDWTQFVPAIEGASSYDQLGFGISLSKDAKRLSIISKASQPAIGFVSNYSIGFNVGGTVFFDADSNSIMNSNEFGLSNQILELEKGSELQYLTTNFAGNFFFDLDTGQHTISYYPDPIYNSNATTYTIDINTSDTILSNLNYGLFPDFSKGDMTVDITTSNTVCNMTTTIWLTVRNEGTETITNVDLDLWVDPAYSVLNSGGGNQSGNHISWNLPGDFYPYIYTGEEQSFSIDVQIPAGPQGSSFVDSVRVTPVQFSLVEIDMNNNFGRADNQILCSYDPNDKQVLPKKCFYNELDTLDFTIRFQNTGNYPATIVTLVDSLDLEKLDIMSFHVLGASHDYEWSLKVPSVLEVVFDNIMLVDSSVSFNESQGFFKYRIVVRDSLADLQPSATPAFIYFDLNEPVVTNLPEINFVSNLSANLQSTNILCNGANNGTATLNISSVTAPYTIAWNGGDTTTSLSNLAVGTYSVTLTDDKTCVYTDSVSITEPNAIVSSNSQSICNGQSITVGSNTYNTSGTYTDVFSAFNGCDSIVTTNLTVLANTSSNTTLSSCDPLNWNGQTYNSSGNYSFTTTNSNGCDSTATLVLTINSTSSSSNAETSCDNYSWNGNTYSSSGTYSWVGTNSNGCDSTATLNLTINSTSSSSSVETSCDSYIWNGNTYSSSGLYSWVGTNSNGCDSTATLNLTINNTTSSSSVETSCDSYSWNGNIYNSSGLYSWVGTNSNGCDSTANLDLTINDTYTSVNNLSICFGESVTVGGNTYNQTGTYTDSLAAVNGCDSTITTQLTIYSDVVSIILQSGNDITVTTIGGTSPYSYYWNTSETTQTISPLTNGEYWVIITDMNSCESDTSFFTVNWITTSIAEININNLTVYPNPSKDIFNVEFNSNTNQDIDLRVHNVLGEVIFSESLKNFNGDYNRSVDLSQYPNAIYILQLNTQDGILNKKLVLEK
tara:strand:+ start:1016 stop:4798 length:3783 start_codon:yes stop_codon:yes gene_type:complete